MSENLKRAESLFNRIMNQNTGPNRSETGSIYSKSSNSGNGGSFNGNKGNKHHYSSHGHSNTHQSNNYNGHYQHLHGSNSYHQRTFKGPKTGGYHSTSHFSHISVVELPRGDPSKIAEEAVEGIPSDHHILPYCWTMWHHSRVRLKHKEAAIKNEGPEEPPSEENGQSAVNTYLQTTKEIEFANIVSHAPVKYIGSIEQLWTSLSSIKRAYDVPIGFEFLIFKSGINPVWEDPINTKGGRWVFRFNRRLNNPANNENEISSRVRQRTTLIWERLLLRILTGSIIPSADYSEEVQDLLLNDISGLVLSVRKDEDIISIWNSNLNFGKKKPPADYEEDPRKPMASKRLTSFQARRIICDAILRVIRECDLIVQGFDPVSTLDSGSNDRVFGVSFEYRLHSDSSNPSSSGYNDSKYPRRFHKSHHGHN